jgi:hypothetical protein
MSDETADDRWTVRGVPKAYRDRAVEAAGRRKLPIGAYVCQALDREIRAEREPLEVISPRSAADKSSDSADKMSDAMACVMVAERAIAAAIALAGAADVPTTFRRRANRLLRESLPPRVTKRTPPLLTDDAARPMGNGAHGEAAHD